MFYTGGELGPYILREQYRLRVLRRIFGSKKELCKTPEN